MIAKLRKYTLSAVVTLTLAFGLSAPVLAPAVASATSKTQICAGIGEAGGNCSSASGQSGLQTAVKFVVQLLSWIVGIAAVIMIIISAIKYTTSGGDAGSVASAKSTLIFAIVGLIVAALAQVIVHFVLGSV